MTKLPCGCDEKEVIISNIKGARNHIKSELENLMSLLWQGKDVKLWLDSYNEIIKLSNGDTNAVTLTHITQGEA